MFKKVIILVLSIFLLAWCWNKEDKSNVITKQEVSTWSKIQEKNNIEKNWTWKTIDDDQIVIDEFEKDLDNLFSELENE